MNFKSFDISSENNTALENEIAFYIASARAGGAELVKFSFLPDNERGYIAAQKILRALKKKGRVEFFELYEKITSDSTEARFLRNKYSDCILKDSIGQRAIIVKL